MAKNGKLKKQNGTVSEEALRTLIEYQRTGNAAIHEAQEENRCLGIPNWYSINGVIVSDVKLEEKKQKLEAIPKPVWAVLAEGMPILENIIHILYLCHLCPSVVKLLRF
jgi:hypothetical protein